MTAAVVNNKVYVIGGYDGKYRKNVEIYNPLTEEWSTGTPMLYAERGHSASVVNGKIYVIGGYNTTVVQIYDPEDGCLVRRKFDGRNKILFDLICC